MSSGVPSSVGALGPFVAAGVFEPSEVHLAEVIDRLVGGCSSEVQLGVALAARATRLGHVCAELAEPQDLVEGEWPGGPEPALESTLPALHWPERGSWVAAVAAAADVVARADLDDREPQRLPLRPLVWDGRHLYLHRYWCHQRRVAEALSERAGNPVPAGEQHSDTHMATVLDALFGPVESGEVDLQRKAAAIALQRRLAIVAGGPGTGKTRTIARLAAALGLRAQHAGVAPPRVALAAPTGKAAARMGEAIGVELDAALGEGVIGASISGWLGELVPSTIHRLIGAAPGRTARFGPKRHLPYDWVIVDEVSMVSLPLMRYLLDAISPSAGLVLVGDPDQLVSVEVGTVMSDIVGPTRFGSEATVPLEGLVTVLSRPRRFGAASPVALLAEAVRRGDLDAVLDAFAGHAELRLISPLDAAALAELEAEIADGARRVVQAAGGDRGDEGQAALDALGAVSVLAAHRVGPSSVGDWIQRVESSLRSRGEIDRDWYVGRPVIATANDPLTGVSNGDIGVVVADGGVGGLRSVAMRAAGGPRQIPVSRLDRVETAWATTIHKSQGSEVLHAVVSLPTRPSPVTSRELLYTAVTRARERVTVVAGPEVLAEAVARPVQRASGLGDLLWH